MPDDVTRANRDNSVSTDKKLDELYALIDGIETCLFTTRRQDGQLVTRPMQVQQRRSGTDLWFVTDIETHKLDELAHDNHVNCGFYNGKTREWVSVSGTAIITQDRDLIRGLYKPDWKAWFPEQGDQRDGGPDDPRIALILVEAQSAQYLANTKSRPVMLFEVVKAMVTGNPPRLGDERTLGEREIRMGAVREQERPLEQ